MERLTLAFYVFILIAVILVLFALYRYARKEPSVRQKKGPSELDRIKAVLRDRSSASENIQTAIERYLELYDLKGASKSALNEGFHVILLFLKHPNCDAKRFADMQLSLQRRYPELKYQIESLGEKAFAERKKKQ